MIGDAEVSITRQPEAPLLGAPLIRASELRANVNLVRELAVVSFRLKYAGSALGYVWSLIRPLLIFGMMYVVFAQLLQIGKGSKENFPVELLLGIVVWSFFADATGTALTSIVGNADMIKKAFFPRWILVLAATLSATMTLGVNLALVLSIGAALRWFTFSLESLWFIPLLVELYLLTLGVSLLLAALYVYYRDLTHVWEVVLQALFFGSGIVFPLSFIQSYRTLLALTPTAQLIEDMRRSIVSPSIPWTSAILGHYFAVPLLLVIGSLALGIAVFKRYARRFGEQI